MRKPGIGAEKFHKGANYIVAGGRSDWGVEVIDIGIHQL